MSFLRVRTPQKLAQRFPANTTKKGISWQWYPPKKKDEPHPRPFWRGNRKSVENRSLARAGAGSRHVLLQVPALHLAVLAGAEEVRVPGQGKRLARRRGTHFGGPGFLGDSSGFGTKKPKRKTCVFSPRQTWMVRLWKIKFDAEWVVLVQLKFGGCLFWIPQLSQKETKRL